MKKVLLISLAVFFAYIAEAQDLILEKFLSEKISTEKNTRDNEDEIVFGLWCDNDSLSFRIIDAENHYVEVASAEITVGNVDVPSTVTYEDTEYTVTAIGRESFPFKDLTSLTLPNTIKVIKERAIHFCREMESITLPESLESIEKWGLYACYGITSLSIPASVTTLSPQFIAACYNITTLTVDPANTVYDSRNNCNGIMETATNKLVAGCQATIIPAETKIIGDYAFDMQTHTYNITLPEGLLEIGEYCFDLTGLTSITIPNTVTTLHDNAFFGMSYLSAIHIPASVTNIGNGVLSACIELVAIDVDENSTSYDSRNNCNSIIDSRTNKLIACCMNSVVPEGVTSIGERVASNITLPDYWQLPNTVTSFDSIAFSYCNGISHFTVPQQVTELPYGLFYHGKFEYVTLPAGIESIKAQAFAGSKIKALYCNSSVAPTLASTDIFDNCDLANLTVYIPCGSLESYQTKWTGIDLTFAEVPVFLRIGTNNARMGQAVINQNITCSNNEAIISAVPTDGNRFIKWNDGNTNNPRTIQVVSDTTFTAYFDNIVFGALCDDDSLVFRIIDARNHYVEVAAAITTQGNVNVPSTVTFEDTEYTVTAIGSASFYRANLTSLTLPNTVKTIKRDAIASCQNLESVTLSESLETIEMWGFYACYALSSLAIPASVTTLAPQFSSACYGIQSITVDPANTVFDSRNNCNAIMETSTDKLVFGCQNTNVPNDTKIIGDYAFNEQINLSSITLPNGLLEIGEYSFYYTTISSLTIPNTVTTIHNNAFFGMGDITALNIPASVTSIGYGITAACSSLETISVDENNTSYDNRNDCNCIIDSHTNKLLACCKNSIVPEGVTSVGHNAVAFIPMPSDWQLPSTITSFDSIALGFCKGVSRISIPSQVTEIPYGLLAHSDFEYVTLPAGIEAIKDQAFAFTNLKALYCHSTVAPTLESSIAFSGCHIENLTVYIPCGSLESYQTKWACMDFTFVEVPAFLTVNTNNAEMGQAVIDREATCSNGEAVISATPTDDYCFIQWNDGNTDNPRTIQVVSDTTFTAIFEVCSGIEENTEDQLQIIANDGSIYIYGAIESNVRIYDIMGRLIVNDKITDGKQYRMPQSGVYMVCVENNPTKKIIVF